MKFKKFAVLGIIVTSAVMLSACKANVSSQGSATGASSNSASQGANQVVGSEIDYTDSGFSPANLNVKAGQTITIKNTSSGAMSFNSDPHPVHTSFPELNLGRIDAGQSKTLTLTKAGTYTYHNHLSPSQKGTIVVQ